MWPSLLTHNLEMYRKNRAYDWWRVMDHVRQAADGLIIRPWHPFDMWDINDWLLQTVRPMDHTKSRENQGPVKMKSLSVTLEYGGFHCSSKMYLKYTRWHLVSPYDVMKKLDQYWFIINITIRYLRFGSAHISAHAYLRQLRFLSQDPRPICFQIWIAITHAQWRSCIALLCFGVPGQSPRQSLCHMWPLLLTWINFNLSMNK